MNESNQQDTNRSSNEGQDSIFFIKQEPLDIESDDAEVIQKSPHSVEDVQLEIMSVEDPLNLAARNSKRKILKRCTRLINKGHESVDENLTNVPRKRGRPRKVKSVELPLECPKKICKFSCTVADDLSTHIKLKHEKKKLKNVENQPRKTHKTSGKVKEKPTTSHHDSDEESKPMPEIVDASGAVVRIEKTNNNGKCMYTCSRCKNAFCKLETAEAHIFKVHKNVKRYICSECGRGFDRSLDLKEHIKVHTRERPFKCPVENCGYASAWSATMKKHVRRRHKDYQGELTLEAITEGRVSKTVKKLVSVKSKDEELEKSETKPSIEDLAQVMVPPVEDVECDIGQLNIFEENNIIDNRNNDVSCYTCKICAKDFENLYTIKCHVNVEHCHLKKCTCMICGIVLSNSGNLVVHMRSHSGERPFQCAECGKCFLSSSDLRRHSRRFQHVSGLQLKQQKCIICKLTLASLYELEKHASTHLQGGSDLKNSFRLTPYENAKLIVSESNESFIFTCNICDTQFSDVTEAQDHVNNDHMNERYNSCVYCGLTFPTRIAARKHKLVHDGKSIKCVNENCDFATDQYANLQLHVSQCTKIPSTAAVRICSICNIEYADINLLRIHFRLDHKLAKSYSCLHCKHSYGSLGDLTQHIESHGAVCSENRCPMENCQFIVTSVEDRAQHNRWHEKRSNPSPRPFVCGTCGKDFCVNAALMRHMRNVHSLPKP